MIKFIPSSIKSRLMSSLPSTFLRNKDGIAAIEFAFIAPVMLFMYFGMAEIATAISVDRQISHSANVAGDLATQFETLSAADMSEVMTATMLVMGIPDTDAARNNVKIEISSFARAADDSVIPRGKATLNGPFPETFNAAALDERILSDTSGIVVARVIYKYEPLKLRYLPNDIDLKEVFMLKPRQSANVDIMDPSGSTEYNCEFRNKKPNCSAGGVTT